MSVRLDINETDVTVYVERKKENVELGELLGFEPVTLVNKNGSKMAWSCLSRYLSCTRNST